MLTEKLKDILNSISQSGIPIRYKDEFYVEEAVLIDYLMKAFQNIEHWELQHNKFSHNVNSLIFQGQSRNIRVSQETGGGYMNSYFDITSLQNSAKEFTVSIHKTFSNRKKYNKLTKLFKKVEDYYLELERGKNRNKIIKSLKTP
jgi:hypothetical protein